MGKLNQVIAVVAGKKAEAAKALTDVYHLAQKPDLFAGLTRTYQPKDEDGDRLPPEHKAVQVRARDLIAKAAEALIVLFDVVATQDRANCAAKADVVVGGKVLLPGVPATHLLFLAKQLKDLETFVGKLPVLDGSERWEYSNDADLYATEPTETVRTKKVPRAHVLYEATKEHPAQVQAYNEDVTAGYWKARKFSGAVPAKERNDMLARVRQLQEAVVTARQEANLLEVTNVQEGKRLLDFVFGGIS